MQVGWGWGELEWSYYYLPISFVTSFVFLWLFRDNEGLQQLPEVSKLQCLPNLRALLLKGKSSCVLSVICQLCQQGKFSELSLPQLTSVSGAEYQSFNAGFSNLTLSSKIPVLSKQNLLYVWPTQVIYWMCKLHFPVILLYHGEVPVAPWYCDVCCTGCAVEDTPDYRTEVLVNVRRLERLDKDPFTEDERLDAEQVRDHS